MTASKKQIKLIEDLLAAGATYPENDNDNPSFSMYESVAEADKFIKMHYRLLLPKVFAGKRNSPAEWGGVLNA